MTALSTPATIPAAAAPGAAPGATPVRNLPVNLFGSVMGLSGLALAWRLAQHALGAPAWIAQAIGTFAIVVFALLALGYLTKLLRHPDAVRAEFAHPIAGNFFGTLAISLLLVAAVIEPYDAAVADVLWTLGALAAFAIGYVIVARLLQGRVDATHAVPAWLVPCVATLDIAVTGGHMPMAWAPELNLCAGAVGGVLALVVFVLIVARLVHQAPLAAAMTPSLMILVAPFAVGFLAYTNIVGGIDRFAAVLFYAGLFVCALVAPRVFRPGIPFSPAWWAIGFPMAALANAALRYAQYRESALLFGVAIVLLGALSLALAVLTVRTLRIAFTGALFR